MKMNKKGLCNPMLSPKYFLKAGGLLLSSLGAFFFFEKYKLVGLSLQIIPALLLSLGMVALGQFIFWRL